MQEAYFQLGEKDVRENNEYIIFEESMLQSSTGAAEEV